MLGHRDRLGVLSSPRARRQAIVGLLVLLIVLPARAEDPASLPVTTGGPSVARQRLAELKTLAASGRAPRFPRWPRGVLLSVDGAPMNEVVHPFERWTVPVRRTQELYPPTVAEPEVWAESQEQLLAVGECPCHGGSGSPGEVPPPSLRIAKHAAVLDLVWSASCSSQASDYAIHEGALGAWYSHTARACSTGGALAWSFTPGPGNRYFLVVPLTADDDGSFGRDRHGVERPAPSPSCRLTGFAETCP